MKQIYFRLPANQKFMILALSVLMISGLMMRYSSAQTASSPGADLVNTFCAACHKSGAAGAPILGNKEQWADRISKGEEELISNAINGINTMPPKGGNTTLDDDLVKDAVLYMIELLEDKSEISVTPQSDNSDKPAVNTLAEVTVKDPASVTQLSKPAENKAKVAPENTFNRLIKPASERNRPPSKDGIHDPENPATNLLQSPANAFEGLPRSQAGNYIDWVKALNDGHITPRFDAQDPNAKPTVIDMNIVREVKGSMPNVVYPHKAHTEWLDCSNCHPAIFEPRKGANQISMAAILLGEKCGVCHGKVAFPVAECRRCHSQKKQPVSQSASAQ